MKSGGVGREFLASDCKLPRTKAIRVQLFCPSDLETRMHFERRQLSEQSDRATQLSFVVIVTWGSLRVGASAGSPIQKRGTMNCNPVWRRQTPGASSQVRRRFACLALLLWVSTIMLGQTPSEGQNAGSAIHVTHILGFEGARHNANGELRIQGDVLQFQQSGNPVAQVGIHSIQNVALGDEDQQVGGVPMMLGKSAVPFGGGRVVSLFSHKKYDSVTVEYVDSNGGFHGAIFRLSKGQGQTFKRDLVASGAHIEPREDQAKTQSAPEVKNENK
jgi:hypothetical protein